MWNSTSNPASQPNANNLTNEPNNDPISQEEEEEEEEEEGILMQEPSSGVYPRYYVETDSSNDTGTESLTWISWFCSLAGHEYFAEVTEDFIEDDFNLTGLNNTVPFYKEALEMILDVEPEEEALKVPDVSIVEHSAELLYGLIHQRFIITRQGLQQMVEKYEATHFGCCPRVYCESCAVVPCGRNDMPGLETVKLFCPNCLDLYTPPSSRYLNIDGAYFGTTFPHLLFQQYPDLLPNTQNVIYEPKIFGFKVNERSRSGPRMQWLRMRPSENDENSDEGAESDMEARDNDGGNDPALFGQGDGENNGANNSASRNTRDGNFGQGPYNIDIGNQSGNGDEVQEEVGGITQTKENSLTQNLLGFVRSEVTSTAQEGSFTMGPLAKLIPFLNSPTSPAPLVSISSPTESSLKSEVHYPPKSIRPSFFWFSQDSIY